MKLKNLMSVLCILAGFSAQAVEVESVKLDAAKENLLVTVSHGGGCGNHSYKLVLGGCLESMPVQCSATIKHTTNDHCEAYLTREAKFNLNEYKLKDKYFLGASLTISGDQNSSASLKFPTKWNETKPSTKPKAGSISCVTHTDSNVLIVDKRVELNTTDGKNAVYKIVSSELISIETFPGIDQTINKLDDGRSLVTEFTVGQKAGSGYFQRLDKSVSPEFKCNKN